VRWNFLCRPDEGGIRKLDSCGRCLTLEVKSRALLGESALRHLDKFCDNNIFVMRMFYPRIIFPFVSIVGGRECQSQSPSQSSIFWLITSTPTIHE
jgi:hypothetical protein